MQTDRFIPARLSAFALTGLTLAAVLLRAVAAELPEPKIIDPGPPPSDAVVLFDGKDLSK